jgi:hypothetical protein
MNEIFDIGKVRQEFLENIAQEYSTIFSEKQLEMCVYMLNDFCTAIHNNGFVLLRADPEQIMQQPQQVQQPQYIQPPVPRMSIPPEYQQPMNIPPEYQQYQQPQSQQSQNPFQDMQMQAPPPVPKGAYSFNQPSRVQVQQNVQELNNQLPKAPAPKQDVDLSPDKTKSFAEKIREMRSSTKKANRINPDDDN